MGVVVPGPFGNSSLGNFQFGFWLGSFGAHVFFCGKWRVEIDVGNLGWSVVVLEGVSPTYITTFNMVDLLPFPLKASFLNERRNSTTLNSLLYALSYCHNISKLLS
jgi:hypothetical protein